MFCDIHMISIMKKELYNTQFIVLLELSTSWRWSSDYICTAHSTYSKKYAYDSCFIMFAVL